MNNRLTESDALETVAFFENNTMFKPKPADLLTKEDTDPYKLESLRKLLLCMASFSAEMNSVGIRPMSKEGRWNDTFLLTDIDYDDFPRFMIRLKSIRFDPEWKFALHAGFSFDLTVEQCGPCGREIADWIDLHIKHFNTVPCSLASSREHVRVLQSFVRSNEDLYFKDLPLRFDTSVSSGKMSDAFSFQTLLFDTVVSDACEVMEKIMRRKRYLRRYSKEE